jgi:hypothetical protein
MIGGRAHRTQPSELQAPVTSVAGFMVEELSEPFGTGQRVAPPDASISPRPWPSYLSPS